MWNRLKVSSLLFLAATSASVPALAGSVVVGLVAGSESASIDSQAVLPHMVIFADDRLQVKDGVAVVAVSDGSRIALGRDTTAAFQRDARSVTVVLSAGSVSVYHANDRVGLRVQAGSVMVEAAPGSKTLGEVAIMDGEVGSEGQRRRVAGGRRQADAGSSQRKDDHCRARGSASFASGPKLQRGSRQHRVKSRSGRGSRGSCTRDSCLRTYSSSS